MTARAHECAGSAAEAIRSLNHVTAPGRLVDRPVSVAELDDALIEIGQLLSRLPQALRQFADILQDRDDAGLISHDSGADVAVAVAEVRGMLGEACVLAQDAAWYVRQAVRHTSHLFELDGVSR